MIATRFLVPVDAKTADVATPQERSKDGRRLGTSPFVSEWKNLVLHLLRGCSRRRCWRIVRLDHRAAWVILLFLHRCKSFFWQRCFWFRFTSAKRSMSIC